MLGEEIEYETRIETKSTSIDTFYTASSDLNTCITDSHVFDIQIVAGKPSNLRVFTVAELKLATRNFCTSSKIGEGGFGSVYRGVVKSLDDHCDEIQVAVKLANGGLQARFHRLFFHFLSSSFKFTSNSKKKTSFILVKIGKLVTI